MTVFNLPDVGEGLTEADIASWKVAVGDTVEVNQIFVEIETAKSLVELPCPFAGVVTALHAAEGDTVLVDTPLITIDQDGNKPAPTGTPEPAEALATAAPQASEEPGPLVGSGPTADSSVRRARTNRPKPSSDPAQLRASRASALTEEISRRAASLSSALTREVDKAKPAVANFVDRVLAKPPVRRLAKELGVDINDVVGTGSQGEVTREDVNSYQAQREAEHAAAPTYWAHGELADARTERTQVRGVRKATAKAMVDSAFTAPHVSIFVDVDASRTMEYVARLKKSRDFEGIKVSPLLVLARAVIWAAARNPSVNASWVETENGAEIHQKRFMNLGIAAATPRGLLVPNIKDAQDLNMRELATALNELATTARAGKTKPEDMRGGTLSITNIGALGIDTGTPIINPGEVAIVAFGTIRQKPWVVDGEVVPRWITTLGGSFDHRVVDGDLSARFMADVASILQEPAMLLD
ncbi:dihydrolipoamide acetyltransferase component of pyruvate dehydrogenase complex [Glutamicibacter uratoxydans]|uniref:Dihydrolipoamide acetyltransferase component of pyruvate dehydrogenase complex n=1 Tax=Glutamicibacter uratoxydans TaxID=43667 RepID=A0A4Y4DMM2_GLUUR|nr:dihydrolipoamide acetyltransferase family protein [Glutamicibacter uratoxydans]GED04860.1 dihydrolipoamide acetyltransferase component of pyruvate dehydrogenase complex [Glutamicibacter uratoxydans]